MMDKAATKAFLSLLPPLGQLEYPLSVPGVWFGMPPILIVCIPGLAIVSSSGPVPSTAYVGLAVATSGLASAWALFLSGNTAILTKYLYGPLAAVLSLPLGLLLASPVKDGFSAGAFFGAMWYAMLLFGLVGKRLCRRQRPLVCLDALQPRHLTIIKDVLLHDVNSSFPSTDTGSAVVFALALASGAGLPLLGLAIGIVASLCRLYWYAHHLLDVLAGAALAALIYASACALGCDAHAAKWWHPLLVEGIFLMIYPLLPKVSTYHKD